MRTCNLCNGELIEIDEYGTVEECLKCGTTYQMLPMERTEDESAEWNSKESSLCHREHWQDPWNRTLGFQESRKVDCKKKCLFRIFEKHNPKLTRSWLLNGRFVTKRNFTKTSKPTYFK